MTDTRTISQLEAEGYPWIGCECCKGTVWVPFKMIRQKIRHETPATKPLLIVALILKEHLRPVDSPQLPPD